VSESISGEAMRFPIQIVALHSGFLDTIFSASSLTITYILSGIAAESTFAPALLGPDWNQ